MLVAHLKNEDAESLPAGTIQDTDDSRCPLWLPEGVALDGSLDFATIIHHPGMPISAAKEKSNHSSWFVYLQPSLNII